MAHQSALLMVDVVGDNRMIMLLGEVENLKAKLEEETNKHNQHAEELQVTKCTFFSLVFYFASKFQIMNFLRSYFWALQYNVIKNQQI